MNKIKPRVCHVTDTLALGGKERMVVDLANCAKQNGIEASVCVTRDNMTLGNELNSDVKRWVLNRRNRFDLYAMKNFVSLISSEKVDILHAHGRSTFSFLAFLKELKLIKQPILFHDHYGAIEVDNTVPHWFKFWAKRHVAHYVGVSDLLKKWALSANLHPSQVSVISNGMDLTRFHKRRPRFSKSDLDIPDNALLGIGVGDRRPDKGWDVFFNAIKDLDSAQNTYFLLAGGASDADYDKKCRTIIENSSLKERVKFLGPRQDIPEFLSLADFAFMPSISESGPLVLIEYLVSGLPVLYTQTGDIGNRIAHYKVPGRVQPRNEEMLRGTFQELISLSAEERKRRGETGKKIADEYFSIQNKMPEWLAIYKKII